MANEPTPETQTEPANETVAATPAAEPKPRRSRAWLKWLLVLVLLAAAAAGGYFYRDHKAKQEATTQAAKVTGLQKQVSDLQAEIKAATAKAKTSTPAGKQPSATTIDNIKASITSGNTAALEGYMSPTVSVIVAASEGVGSRTPAQAVGDITSYIKGTTGWDFALPSATIAKWKAGFYGQYFPSTAVVGKAADGHVISFSFDDNGKISGVFMAASDSLL